MKTRVEYTDHLNNVITLLSESDNIYSDIAHKLYDTEIIMPEESEREYWLDAFNFAIFNKGNKDNKDNKDLVLSIDTLLIEVCDGITIDVADICNQIIGINDISQYGIIKDDTPDSSSTISGKTRLNIYEDFVDIACQHFGSCGKIETDIRTLVLSKLNKITFIRLLKLWSTLSYIKIDGDTIDLREDIN